MDPRSPVAPAKADPARPAPLADAASRLAAAGAELAAARTGSEGAAERTERTERTESPVPTGVAPAATVRWPQSPGRPAADPSVRAVGADPTPSTSQPGADGRPLRAVALRYDPFSGPPRVVASGRGHVAEALLARAREAGVPIEAQPDLVEVLMTLRIDQVIPPALYVAVAQVLAWAYLVDERVGRQKPGIEPPRR